MGLIKRPLITKGMLISIEDRGMQRFLDWSAIAKTVRGNRLLVDLMAVAEEYLTWD